ncbi:hypothetical protein BDR05DRAFT_966163 [Suillus weaverae]|nr:hypothetical protein BDR05DRAFT_966163 [Suillus weaverae]
MVGSLHRLFHTKLPTDLTWQSAMISVRIRQNYPIRISGDLQSSDIIGLTRGYQEKRYSVGST